LSFLASANIVAKSIPSVLDHIFPLRDLFRRRCLVVWIWSLASALLLVALIVCSGLFVSILADRGRLSTEIPRDEVGQFTALTGLPAGVEAAPNPGGAAAPDDGGQPENTTEPVARGPASDNPLATVHVSFPEYGILPEVWSARNQWWGRGLAWLFRNVELLQSNILAAITLLATGLALVCLRAWCLTRLRSKAHQVAMESVATVRRNVHRQALRLGAEDLDGTGLETAQRLFTTDIETVRSYLAAWIEYDCRFPLELACLGAIALSIQPLMTAQCLLFLGIAWFFIESETRKSESNRRLAAELTAAELNKQADGLRSARLVRGLGIEQVDHDHFASHLLKYHTLCSQQDLADQQASYLRPRNFAICAAVTTFLLFILTTKILMGQRDLSIAGGSVFITVWILAAPGVRALRSKQHIRTTASLAAEKIHKYLDQIPSVSQAVGARFLQPLSRVLHFDSVTYRNPAGRVLLNELDLTLEAGQTYSLISLEPLESLTLVSMLPRFIEPQKGRILFDGEDIAWSTLESLRAETVFVGANDPLLPGNVIDNIRGGRSEYTLQQVTDAAKISHAHNFIVKLFDGYESDLPERADQMDVSQRFRLGLARAIIRNPAVLIIEEPLEALDEDSKALLADAYERICKDRTVIFLPGRLSTVRRCDQVIVLHEGRVAAIGPQAKLVSVSPIYRHWEYVHFNEFRQREN
jgi:ATP-binding cassette, subfamily B, bacterial